METTRHYAVNKENHLQKAFNAAVVSTLLFMSACSGNEEPIADDFKPMIPVRTYCKNRLDYISVQPDLKWQFTDVEIDPNGNSYKERTIPNISSQSEALTNCESIE